MDISSEKNGLQSVWVWTDFIVSMGMGKRSNGCVGAAKKGLHVVWMWTDFIVATGMEKRSNGCVDVAKKGLQVVWVWTDFIVSMGMEKRSNGCVGVAKKGLQVMWVWPKKVYRLCGCGQLLYCLWWLFSLCARILENVRQFILCMRFFLLK